MAGLTLRRRLSEPTFALNIALNGVAAAVFTESKIAEILWRWEDEPTMEPQFLGSTLAGKTLQVPFDLKGRDIRLFLRGKTSEGFASATNISDYVQKVVTPGPSPEGEFSEVLSFIPLRLFEYYTDVQSSPGIDLDAYTSSILGGTLDADGDSLEFQYVGVAAKNTNIKSVSVTFAGTIIFATGNINHVGFGDWKIVGQILRKSQRTALCSVVMTSDYITIERNTLVAADLNFVALESLVLVISAGTDAGDNVAKSGTVDLWPSSVLPVDTSVKFLGETVTFLGDTVKFTP